MLFAFLKNHLFLWSSLDILFQVEDFLNAISTDPLSAIPVQFLVQMITPPTCQIPPRIIGIPIEQSCTPLQVGRQFSSRLIAVNNCGSNVNISDIATLSFTGMTQGSTIRQNSTHYYKTLSWTPTSSQVGFQVLCAMAVDR